MAFESFMMIAQIAVALTGFIGITIAVRQGREARFSRLFLASILQTTLGAAFFAVLPDFLARLMTPDLMWRVACSTFGIYHLVIFVLHVVRQRSVKQMSALQKTLTAASVPVIGLKLSVGLGYLVAYAYSIYYLGLIWQLVIACSAFAIVLFHVEDDGAT